MRFGFSLYMRGCIDYSLEGSNLKDTPDLIMNYCKFN